MEESKEQQLFFMRQALLEAEKGRFSAPPNPWVGCILVNQGEIVGRGFHRQPGSPHAEVEALQKAGEKARGATAYITLEPCSKQGRTPPCTDALIAAGIKHVVIPFSDPDLSFGGGISQLEEMGISVTVGIGKEEAKRSLAPYLHHRKRLLPFCMLKSAWSIDGCSAALDGSSKWITSPVARRDAAIFRARSQAILVGVETALQDQPHLAAEGKPLRCVLDPQGRLDEEGPLFDPSIAPTLIFTKSKREWRNAEAVQASSLKEVLLELGRRGVLQLFVEGGASVHSSFVKEGFVDSWLVYIGNCMIGSGKKLDLGIQSIAQVPRLSLESVVKLGDDVRLLYTPFNAMKEEL